MAVLIILGIFISTLIAISFYRSNYWKRRGVPGPPSKLFIGVTRELSQHESPSVFQYRKWTEKYGKYYGIMRGWKNVLVISDPDMVHEMMTTKFEYFHERQTAPIKGNVDESKLVNVFRARGRRWKRLRTLSNPAFSVSNLKKLLPTLDDSANETVMLLEKKAAAGKSFNIHPYFHEFTMDTISRIAMGQLESRQFQTEYTDILLKTLKDIEDYFTQTSWMFPILSPILNVMQELYAKCLNKGFVRLVHNTRKAVHEKKEKRKAGDVDEGRIDFIDLFLDAESNDVQKEHTGVYDKNNVQVARKMTTDEVVAQCNVFLIAGFDTTANTLALTAYLLAKNPHVQAKMVEEIERECFTPSPTYEELNKLKYCDAVMKEVLRLYPIAGAVFNRTCAQNTTLGNVEIEAGCHVQVDVISLQRDKSIWGENADDFVPERWLEDKPPNAFYAFGGGPRICIGMRLAYIEEKLVLVHILRRYRFVESPETEKSIEMYGNVVLNPVSINVKLEAI